MPETDENKREQIEVRLLMADPMMFLNWPEGSFENLREGERLSKELGDKKNLAYLQTLTGVYYAWKKGELLLGIKYCEDSFKESENINDIGLMTSTGGYLCLLYWWKGECHKSVDVAPKVIALLEKTRRQSESFGRPFNLYSVIHAWYANCMAMLGNFEEAKALLEKGLAFALKIKDLRALAVLELQSGWVRNFRGDGKNAIAHFQNCIRYCEEGFIALFGIIWGNLGWSYFLLGDLKSSREYTEKGLKFHSGAENQTDMGLFYWILSMIYLESDDLEKAQNHAEKALKLSQKMRQKWIEGFAWILLGRISGKAEKSHVEKAEESILQGIKILYELKLKALYVPGYHYLGKLYADSGQKDKALDNLKKAEMMFQEMGMNYWLAKTQEVLRSLNG
jgi:tetratricopeptide (TPR) repeat protein